MKEPREELRFEHILLQTEDEKNYVLMGLEMGKEYTDSELVSLCKMPVRVYPEGMLYDLFKLTGEERKKAREKMVSLLNVMYGYNWEVIRDYILACYEEKLWKISDFLSSSFYSILNTELNKNYDEFENRYGSYSNYKTTQKVYNRLTSTETKNKPWEDTRRLMYKICAMYCISPKLVESGQGKVFAFYPSVTRREDFPEKLEKYKRKIVRDFANDLSNDMEFLDPSNGNLTVPDITTKNKIIKEHGTELTKENVAAWMEISPDEIIEIEGVIPFGRQNENTSRIKKINNMLKK